MGDHAEVPKHSQQRFYIDWEILVFDDGPSELDFRRFLVLVMESCENLLQLIQIFPNSLNGSQRKNSADVVIYFGSS